MRTSKWTPSTTTEKVRSDCPYLAPVPYRGKRNESAFVREMAKKLAEVKGASFEELERSTDANFHRPFRKSI